MSHLSTQRVEPDATHRACAAQQGAVDARGRSRRRSAVPKLVKLLPFGMLAVVALAAGDLMAAGRATAAPQELIVIEHATTDAVTDTGASGDSAGDILTFANDVFDEEDRVRVGGSQGMCVRTVPGAAWECFWTLSLDSGQITVEGPFYDAGDSVLAVTGGTGAFANAQGDMLLTAIGTEGTAFRFTYRLL